MDETGTGNPSSRFDGRFYVCTLLSTCRKDKRHAHSKAASNGDITFSKTYICDPYCMSPED